MPVPSGIKPKALRQLLAKAEDQGAHISITRGTHVRVRCPEGVVFLSYTSSDTNVVKIARAQLNKKGLDL